jgi:hypothetical protein
MSSDSLWQYRDVEQISEESSEEQVAESTESEIADLLASTNTHTQFPTYELPPELSTQAWNSDPAEPTGIEEPALPLTTAFSTLNIHQEEPELPSPSQFAQPSTETQFPPTTEVPLAGEEDIPQQSTEQVQTHPMENIPYRFGLGPHAETYSGFPGENLRRWIISTNFLLEAYPEWTGAQQVRAVYPLLRDNAKDWFHGVMGTPNEPRNWRELAQRLMQVFRTEQHMYRYEESLDKIKQSKFANLEQYFAAFRALANELSDMPKRHLVYKFAKGLTSLEARHTILNTPECTLERAYEIASSRALGARIANPNATMDYNDGVAPMDLDAFVAQGRNNTATQNRNDVICWNCLQPGHLARTCRRRRNRRQQQPQQQQPQQQNQGRRQGQLRNIDTITDEEWRMILEYRQLRNGNNNGNDNAAPPQQENLPGQ